MVPEPGNTERQQRHERTRRRGIVGGFGRGQAAQRTRAELFFLCALGEIAIDAVGEKRRDGRAGARQHADQEAQHRRARNGRCDLLDFFLAQFHAAELGHILRLGAFVSALQHRHQRLGEREGGHGEQQEADAIE